MNLQEKTVNGQREHAMVAQNILLTTLLAASIAPAPQPKDTRAITTETILELTPSIPENLKAKITGFFEQHPKIIPVLSGEAYYRSLPSSTHAPLSIDFRKLTSADKKFLSHIRKSLLHLMPKISKRNYRASAKNFLIKVDDHWFIKASALFNRRANILHEMGLNNRNFKLPDAQLATFITTKGGRTFQTISRMFYWLLAKRAQKELHLDRIGLPHKYLFHIPGRPTTLDDTNYVVVVEKISGAQPILHTDLLEDREVVAQLAHIIVRASLWDIHGDNILVKDGKAYLIDFEQINACKPSEFGREDLSEAGIAGLKTLIRKHAQKTKRNLMSLENLVTEIAGSYNK